MYDQFIRSYWNVHKNLFSVQDYKTGRVIDRANDVFLINPSFIVRQGGRERVIKEGKKNVHAFVVGYRPSRFTAEEWDVYYIQGKTWRDVTYNPYKNTTFVYKDTGETVGNDMTMVKLMTKEGRPLIKVYS
tara:strand:- start:2733 stop:3125 length:393 start_codon:yes stop_codon:yes gene_type:complete